MPTYAATVRFYADYRRLRPEQRAAFDRARKLFFQGLTEGRFHPSLRVKSFKSKPGMWELTWAPDGRALWSYGPPQPGHGSDPHVIWARVGSHDIFRD
ncbi:hypothetical protein ACG83_10280 [Frankia sp. R43]|uniref:hypothetical protein n=1 Tax=Frankia sp. R43 TaxID=269536 RepID=UPI0006CA21DF|nr:hypothetical protein [Frankia sp. R43]KPM55667.1 hypothetical protein ACG83_10280 [Frankia sp. R43]